jgi:hypothetical protein
MSHAHLSELAFATETVPGVPPADGAAWLADGVRVRHLQESLDVASLVPSDLEDLRSQTHVLDHERRVEGLRNGEIGFQTYLTGTGATASAGNQAIQNSLGLLLANAMGGVHRSNSTTLDGSHTATTIEPDADTEWDVGGHIAWEDAAGNLHVRRLVSETAGVWTLDQALPATPQDNDVIHGCATYYPDSSVLGNSASAGRQLSAWIRKSGINLETWVLMAGKLQLGALNFPRGELTTVDFLMHYANMILPHESPPLPAWATEPDGEAPVPVVDMVSFLQEYGTATASAPCINDLTIEPGLPILRDEVQTSNTAGMQGTCKYYLGRGETIASLNIDFDHTQFDRWADGDFVVFRYANRPITPGGGLAFGMPRAEVMLAPSRSVNNETPKQTLQLKAHRDLASIGATELARAPFVVVQF